MVRDGMSKEDRGKWKKGKRTVC
jgi:hypothetical protein